MEIYGHIEHSEYNTKHHNLQWFASRKFAVRLYGSRTAGFDRW